MKIIFKYNLFLILNLFAFHTNKKQYLGPQHKVKKKEKHIRMHNNDFDMLLRQIAKNP